MSFRDETSFSMVAGSEKLHEDRVFRLEEHETRILPIGTIFGGNASGKSNFFKAINFAKLLVMKGRIDTDIFSVSPFKLDPKFENLETNFSFEILAAGNLYEFEFTVFRKEIQKEKMSIIKPSNTEVLYKKLKSGRYKLHPSLKKRKYVELISANIPKDELFLNNIMRFGQNESWPVFDWFNDSLVLVSPEITLPTEKFLKNGGNLLSELNRLLPYIDCGIERIDRVRNDSSLDVLLASPYHTRKLATLGEGESHIAIREGIVVKRINGELVPEKLYLIHPGVERTDVKYEFSEESDGTLRVLDLLPRFLDLTTSESPMVCIVDEIDRSLHTRLVNKLVSAYLLNCTPKTKSQLIFTAHDVMLMNTELLRRDEIWISSRLNDGSTEMFSIGDFNDVNNERIHLDYLQGFLGGLPNVMLGGIDFGSKRGKK